MVITGLNRISEDIDNLLGGTRISVLWGRGQVTLNWWNVTKCFHMYDISWTLHSGPGRYHFYYLLFTGQTLIGQVTCKSVISW